MVGVLRELTLLLMTLTQSPAKTGEAVFDLETFRSSTLTRCISTGLELSATCRVIGGAGLSVTVTLTNQGKAQQSVPDFNPVSYPLVFRDDNGHVLDVYQLPDGYPKLPLKSEFIRLAPGRSLRAHYEQPTFYRRIRVAPDRRVQCRVSSKVPFLERRDSKQRLEFKLDSDWVDVPAHPDRSIVPQADRPPVHPVGR